MIKSLVDWEKTQRESQRKKLSSEEDNLAKDSGESKGREELPSNFEKMKAQKSTIEAAVSEVNMCEPNGTKVCSTEIDLCWSIMTIVDTCYVL